jgi:hypothetical protein
VVPITYWGARKERERDHCVSDPENVTDRENACCKAPEGTRGVQALRTELHTLVIEPGWYRHSPYSTEVLPCRYEFECKGWNNANHAGLNTTAVSAGEDLCADGYTGPMCRYE